MRKSFMPLNPAVCCLVFFLWGLAGTAAASTIGINDLASLYENGSGTTGSSALKDGFYRYDSATQDNPLGDLTGVVETLHLGDEAGSMNTLAKGFTTISTNNNSSVFSTAFFSDLTSGSPNAALNGNNNFDVYKDGTLLRKWAGNDWFVFIIEYYGFAEDQYLDNDCYDYIVFPVRTKGLATPIPGTVLLFGSGVLGLIGFGVRRRSAGRRAESRQAPDVK